MGLLKSSVGFLISSTPNIFARVFTLLITYNLLRVSPIVSVVLFLVIVFLGSDNLVAAVIFFATTSVTATSITALPRVTTVTATTVSATRILTTCV